MTQINALTTTQSVRLPYEAYLVVDRMDSGGTAEATVKVEADDLPQVLGINDGVVVYSAGWRPTVYKPSANTDAARGVAFLAASAAATSGQTVIAAPGSYDLAGAFVPVNGVEYRCHDCTIYHSINDTGLIVPAVADGAVHKIYGGHWDNRGSRVSDYCRVLDMREGTTKEDITEVWFYPQSVNASAEASSAIYLQQGRLYAHLPYVRHTNYDCIEIAGHESLTALSAYCSITAGLLRHGQASGSPQSNGIEIAGAFQTATGSVRAAHIINDGPGPSVNVNGSSFGLVQCLATVDKVTVNNTAGQAVQLNGNAEVRVGHVEVSQFSATTGLDSGVALVNFLSSDNRCFVDFLDGGTGWACNWGAGSRCELHTRYRRGAFALSGSELTTDAAFRSLSDAGNIEVTPLPIHTTDPSVGNVPEWSRYFLGNTLKYHNAETGTLDTWS